MRDLMIYHGSQQIIKKPVFGEGKAHNDYGLGFYCTEHLDLAKEWACSTELDGYTNKYRLPMSDLRVFSLSSGETHIMNWLALLLMNRSFRISSDLAREAKEYIIAEFNMDIQHFDVIKGYRADDSYFSFAQSFLNGGMSLEQLSKAMKLGNLGEQIVLKSEKAFSHLVYVNSEKADARLYQPRRELRDIQAKKDLIVLRHKKASDETYVLDMLRERWKNDDARLQ